MTPDADLFPECRAAAMPPIAGNCYLGTSGYSFPDWRGTVYPAHVSDREMLAHYLNEWQFNALELNVTFYRMPDAALLEAFAQRTPPQYQLAVKAYRDITHAAPGADPLQACAEFARALAPLRQADKLAAVLLQFPTAFHDTPAARDHLHVCQDELGDVPLAVEFRHVSWNTPAAAEFLRTQGMAFCAADEPALPGLMPFTDFVTAPLGYVRLHGRNRAWFTAGEKDRYNYDYSTMELRALIARVRAMAAQTKKLLIFFNNCHMGRAVRNARAFRDLLSA
jgi:uncharacterized protein YecE (DUF72 family)